MIKTSLEQIVDTHDNFRALLNVSLPTKVAYWVNRIYNKVLPLVEQFKEDQNKLIKKYGEGIMGEDKKITKYEVKEGENKEKYLKEIDDLVKKEVEICFDDGTPFYTIPLRALEKLPIAPKMLIDYVFSEDSEHPAFKKGLKED